MNLDPRGSLKVDLFGIPTYLHWSCLLLLGWGLSNVQSPAHVALSLAASVAIIVVHELGHAAAVALFGRRVDHLFVHGFGGHCASEELYSTREHKVVSAAGVVFQAVLLLLAVAVYHLFLEWGVVNEYLRYVLISKFVFSNAFILVLNLLPIPGFDGYELYRFRGFVRKAKKRPASKEPEVDADPSRILKEMMDKAKAQEKKKGRKNGSV